MHSHPTIALVAVSCLAPTAAFATEPADLDQGFACYVQSAEARMDARKAFLITDSDSALNEQLVRGQIRTIPANGANPHKITGGQLYDFLGSVFIPDGSLDRTIRMLQDYDHRAQYFPEILSASKLLCHTGENHFRFSMRLKEPAVMDVESDVVWQHVDPQRWRCRSYSMSVKEVGKDHGYVLRLYSYWRFAQAGKGVYVEAETITVSREFSGFTRALGSMIGISPEKSLKRTLESMRESVLKPGLEFAKPPAGIEECGEPVHPGACTAPASH